MHSQLCVVLSLSVQQVYWFLLMHSQLCVVLSLSVPQVYWFLLMHSQLRVILSPSVQQVYWFLLMHSQLCVVLPPSVPQVFQPQATHDFSTHSGLSATAKLEIRERQEKHTIVNIILFITPFLLLVFKIKN